MAMRLVAAVAAVLVVGALGFTVLDQEKRIERLSEEVEALRTAPRGVTAVQAPLGQGPVPRPSMQGARGEAAPSAAPAAPPVPRAAVTQEEVARVESAVLSLLESDHPELREKLRAVVQEQQQSLEQAEREERRERWIARNDARLLELGANVGLNAEQRQVLSDLLLATRDQIADIRRSAETPEQISAARDKVRDLREQSDAQVRELLTTPQYEAFKAEFDDDDDERRDRRRARNSPPP